MAPSLKVPFTYVCEWKNYYVVCAHEHVHVCGSNARLCKGQSGTVHLIESNVAIKCESVYGMCLNKVFFLPVKARPPDIAPLHLPHLPVWLGQVPASLKLQMVQSCRLHAGSGGAHCGAAPQAAAPPPVRGPQGHPNSTRLGEDRTGRRKHKSSNSIRQFHLLSCSLLSIRKNTFCKFHIIMCSTTYTVQIQSHTLDSEYHSATSGFYTFEFINLNL